MPMAYPRSATKRGMVKSEATALPPLPLDRDTAHDLLSSERRRQVLSCLTDHSSMALPDLADEIASREYDGTLAQVPADAVLQIYRSLYQTHVPKLEAADVLNYDQDQDLVTPAENAPALRQFRPPRTKGGE